MDLENQNNSAAEPSVDEGAFWHTNMDLYYGYVTGELVEVEHEPMKYWLARIEFSYKHLVLLKWLGNYGEEFWIDTSLASSAASSISNNTSCVKKMEDDNSILTNYPRRLFPLGHHLQPQIKSQFMLEKPTKILTKPSLYNPAKDPYADIKTVDDLLAHDVDSTTSDAFASQSTSNSINEPVSLTLVKNKTKINYGQEDQAELEEALQNLNDEIDEDTSDFCSSPKLPLSHSLLYNFFADEAVSTNSSEKIQSGAKNKVDSSFGATNSSNCILDSNKRGITDQSCRSDSKESSIKEQNGVCDIVLDEMNIKSKEQDKHKSTDEAHIEMCRRLQESALSKGRYMGIKLANNVQCEDEIYFLKPKQLFDIGGVNQERVFVPGTLVEICHSIETAQGLSLFHWFAYIIKNIGGRLTLRWFLCTEPKFKQGRLELKSFHSLLIREDTNSDNNSNLTQGDEPLVIENKLSSKSITFSLHFCDPKIHTIPHGKPNGRTYRLPNVIIKYLRQYCGFGQDEEKFMTHLNGLEKSQMSYVLDSRRMNLDKDRPLIDHILSTARIKAPNYLDLIFAPKDNHSKREILVSCPKLTKLSRGHIRREIEPNVFEICLEPLHDGDINKFIYPYDSSYAILPLSWAQSHQDCLSIDPSRNASPSSSDNKDESKSVSEENIVTDSEQKSNASISDTRHVEDSKTPCLLASRSKFPRPGGSFHKLPNLDDIPELKTQISNFDDYDPKCWSAILRSREIDAPCFHFCIDQELRNWVEAKFKVMDQLEVVHPSSDSTICSGRIRKVAYPLLWIQISADSYTVLPFNSTNIYPARWCETYQHPLVSFLPPRKRQISLNSGGQSNPNDQKKKKKLRINDELNCTPEGRLDYDQIYVKESFDLGALDDRQSGIDHILDEKSMYIKIYFNHKCFTGPSLSKSKICTLPQYVGPGPMRLVIEEVVTKVISVAYVPPRILNDLSSKAFEDLLILRNLKNTTPVEFKAKYQKRVHREEIPVCFNPDDVALYCECLCEHLKCCYNLFGPNQYDGDDCPGHCRALTKSNKFMKRATYYRDKARAGEFLGSSTNNSGDGHNSKKSNGSSKTTSTSRPRYAGRGSSESTNSSISRSDQIMSRASSPSADGENTPIKEEDQKVDYLDTLPEEDEQPNIQDVQMDNDENICTKKRKQTKVDIQASSIKPTSSDALEQRSVLKNNEPRQEMSDTIQSKPRQGNEISTQQEELFDTISGNNSDLIANDPNEWTVADVCRALEALGLNIFVHKMRSECIDGRALLLLDEATIEEHFQKQSHIDLASDELEKLCRFVEFAKFRLAR